MITKPQSPLPRQAPPLTGRGFSRFPWGNNRIPGMEKWSTPGILPKGVLIDEAYRPLTKSFYWRINYAGYVLGSRRFNGVRQYVRLHRMLLGVVPDGLIPDHINRNPLDNRMENLRLATPHESVLNRAVVEHPYAGVFKSGKWWRVELKRFGVLVKIGRFATREEGRLAKEAWLREHF